MSENTGKQSLPRMKMRDASSRLASLVVSKLADYGVVSQQVAKPQLNLDLVKINLVASGKDVVLTTMIMPHRREPTMWKIWVDEIYPDGSRRLVIENNLPSDSWAVIIGFMASCLEEAEVGLGETLHSIAVKEGLFDTTS